MQAFKTMRRKAWSNDSSITVPLLQATVSTQLAPLKRPRHSPRMVPCLLRCSFPFFILTPRERNLDPGNIRLGNHLLATQEHTKYNPSYRSFGRKRTKTEEDIYKNIYVWMDGCLPP